MEIRPAIYRLDGVRLMMMMMMMMLMMDVIWCLEISIYLCLMVICNHQQSSVAYYKVLLLNEKKVFTEEVTTSNKILEHPCSQ